MNVIVLGPGLMGSQIACEYALGGHAVTVLARRPEVAWERIGRGLATAIEHGLAGAEEVAAARERITVAGDDADVAEVEIIVESVVEDLDAKIAALRLLAARNQQAIIASNTSSLPITAIGAAVDAGERTVGAHYWNPPLLMPMVEVIRGSETSAAAVGKITATLRALGKRPVLVARDVPGFAWNRLQLALLREAVWLVENGVAAPETVDEIVRDGLARRWRYTGPFQTAALGGARSLGSHALCHIHRIGRTARMKMTGRAATFERVAANLWPVLSCATELADLRRWLDETPETTGPLRERRDQGLAADLHDDRDRESGAAS